MSTAVSVTHRLELPGASGETPSPRDDLRLVRAQRERPKHDNVLSGSLAQMSLFSILQALSDNASTGNLTIDGANAGSLYVEQGQLVFAALGRHRGAKALYRIIEITEGRFDFFSPGRKPSERNLAGSLSMHLIEAARHGDEMTVLREALPKSATELRFNMNMVAPVAKIPYPMLEVLAAIRRHGNVAAILDGCGLPDLDIAKILLSLLKHNVIHVVEP